MTATPVDPVSGALADVLAAASAVSSGEVADYIPELAHADPGLAGLAATSVLGRTYAAGDATVPFTIQSISKPFVFALVAAELGLDGLAAHVGFEPSGDAFNAISLEPGSGRPANPMINAGAIVTSALVPGATPGERFERIRSLLSAFAGRRLEVDERVYASESRTGDRNRALAHLTLAAGVLPRPVDDAVEVYFRQCSLVVTAVDLAVMGATLANGGVNPLTGDTVIDELVAEHTLSVMAACGMYDYAGEWMLRVGLPAKSGVGGGIVAVQPGQFGLGVFSPPLDERGNSARGVAALTALSRDYGLHLLAHPTQPLSPIEAVRQEPDGRTVVALRGELDFLAIEQLAPVLRGLAAPDGETPRAVVIDLTAVTLARPIAGQAVRAIARRLEAIGLAVTVEDPAGVLPDPPAVPG